MRWLLGVPGRLLDRIDGPQLPPQGPRPEAVYPLVRAQARHPEAHLALERGLHYRVHAGHVLAYEIRGRTAFAVGGLNAPPGQRVELLRSWRTALGRRGVHRQLCFPVRPEELADVRRAGMEHVQVGVEAWLDVDALSGGAPEDGRLFRGSRYAEVRYMRNRAGRRGVEVAEVRPEEHAEELGRLHRAWLESKRPSWRMKLLVGSPGLEQPFDRRYFVATHEERLVAFLTWLPGGPGCMGLDVMCRDPQAPPGTMERLICHAVQVLAAEGISRLSLGACPMAGVPVEGARLGLKRVFATLYGSQLGNRVFGFRSLHRFKAKFRPRWGAVHVAAAPRLGALELYLGCRMWGLY